MHIYIYIYIYIYPIFINCANPVLILISCGRDKLNLYNFELIFLKENCGDSNWGLFTYKKQSMLIYVYISHLFNCANPVLILISCGQDKLKLYNFELNFLNENCRDLSGTIYI